MTEPKYRRVLLKVSGEALAGEKGFGINPPIVNELIKETISNTQSSFNSQSSRDVVFFGAEHE